MKENKWGSTLCLLVPTERGPFMAGFHHSCGVGKNERKWSGLRRHSTPGPSFLLKGHLRENISWCACSDWAQPNPAHMGCREAAGQIFTVLLLSGYPTTPQPHTNTHMHPHSPPQKSASFCLSVQAHPSSIQVIKYVLFH